MRSTYRLRDSFAITLCVALAATALIAGRSQAASTSWEERAPMPTPRHEAAVTRSGRNVYVLGGLIAGLNAVPLVDVYDIKTDSWSQGPPLPYAPNHAMAAAHEGIVYHLGGYQLALELPSDRALALVEGSWVDLPPMPEPRAAGAADFHGGKLYVVGGVGPDGVQTETFIFDPGKGEWSTAPGPKTPREHHSLVRHGRFLYALGGRALTFESNMASVERFDPIRQRWKTVFDLPYATSGQAATVTSNGFLVVLGGESAQGTFANAVAYDLLRKRWISLPPLEPSRTGFGAAAFGARVFVFHGASAADPGYYSSTQTIDLSDARLP